MLLRVNPHFGYVIGVDVGETHVHVELFDLDMSELAKAEYPSTRPGTTSTWSYATSWPASTRC